MSNKEIVSEAVLSCDLKTAVNAITKYVQSHSMPDLSLESLDRVDFYEQLQLWITMPTNYQTGNRNSPKDLTLTIDLFAEGDNTTALHVQKVFCDRLSQAIIRRFDRYWRTCIGQMYEQGLITSYEGLRAILVCEPEDEGWVLKQPIQRALIEILRHRISKRKPIMNANISDDLAKKGFFNISSGENFHEDTVRRWRTKTIKRLAQTGYFDVLDSICKLG